MDDERGSWEYCKNEIINAKNKLHLISDNYTEKVFMNTLPDMLNVGNGSKQTQ
jgi:hypothetical protein